MESSTGSGSPRPGGANEDANDWQTADRATDALIAAAARHSASVPARRPSGNRSKGPLIGAAALLAGGFGVWLVTRDSGSDSPAKSAATTPVSVGATLTEVTEASVVSPTTVPAVAANSAPTAATEPEATAATAPAAPLVPAAAAGEPVVPFRFTLKPDGKAYASGSLPDDAAVQAVVASGEAVVGAGNVVLQDLTTNPAATYTPSRDTLVSTSFYYTQGNAEMSLDHQLRIDVIIGMMQANPNMVAYISGFSDATGSAVGNLELSNKRATNIADYMRSKGLIDTQWRLRGVGEDSPVGDNSTESGRALNRRVDIQLDGQNLGL